MQKPKDLAGTRFGRLMVLEFCDQDLQKRFMWRCLCDCGNEKIIRSRHLTSGQIRSCGCLMRESSVVNGKVGAKKHSGSKSHLYKADLTQERREKTRNLVQLREWVKQVFERDNHTCDLCKRRGKGMHAHHLNCWPDYPDERFLLANGITLCKSCHKNFHHSLPSKNRSSCSRLGYEKFKSRWYLNRYIDQIDFERD